MQQIKIRGKNRTKQINVCTIINRTKLICLSLEINTLPQEGYCKFQGGGGSKSQTYEIVKVILEGCGVGGQANKPAVRGGGGGRVLTFCYDAT